MTTYTGDLFGLVPSSEIGISAWKKVVKNFLLVFKMEKVFQNDFGVLSLDQVKKPNPESIDSRKPS